MVCGRIVAVEEEVVGALVGVGVHEESAAGCAIATGAADLLVVAFERAGEAGVDDRTDVGLVDAHAKGDGGDDNFKPAGLECTLHALAGFGVESGVIRSGGGVVGGLL